MLKIIVFMFLTLILYNSEQKCIQFDPLHNGTNGIIEFQCTSLKDLDICLENATILTLVGTGSGSLRAKTFEKTTRIKTLEVRGLLFSLERGAFTTLPRITKVTLFDNVLSQIQAGIFADLPKLEFLQFRNNSMTRIFPGAFGGSPELKELRINYERLDRIGAGVFNNLSVEIVDLSNNKIFYIVEDAFKDTKNLKELILENNILTQFTAEEYINNLDSIERLQLGGNMFDAIMFDTFRGLSNLRYLILSNNRIATIEDEAFYSLEHLQALELQNNSLTVLPHESFPKEGMLELEELYINDNQLSYLTISMMARLNALGIIRLTGNPWICPCLDLLLIYLQENFVDIGKCDTEYYFSGSRPVCIVPTKHPDACSFDYQNYIEEYSTLLMHYPRTTEEYCSNTKESNFEISSPS